MSVLQTGNIEKWVFITIKWTFLHSTFEFLFQVWGISQAQRINPTERRPDCTNSFTAHVSQVRFERFQSERHRVEIRCHSCRTAIRRIPAFVGSDECGFLVLGPSKEWLEHLWKLIESSFSPLFPSDYGTWHWWSGGSSKFHLFMVRL